MAEKIKVSGLYRRCTVCEAGVVIMRDGNLPDGYLVTLTKEDETIYITPHKPGCGT